MNVKKLFIKFAANWPVKVLSIALALILFVFNRMNTLSTRSMSVPLLVETGFSLIPVNPYQGNIRVNLRGEDIIINSIIDSDIEAYIDLTGYNTEGTVNAPVQIRKKGSAIGVEPLEITVSPLEIAVELIQDKE